MTRKPHVLMTFKGLSIPEKVIFGTNVHNHMFENAAVFVAPDVPLATLLTIVNNLKTSAEEARSGNHAKVAKMNADEKIWNTTFDKEAKYVDRIANGDESTILKSGFKATKSETQPAAIPAMPVITEAKVNSRPGSVHVEIKLQHGVKNYLYFFSTDGTQINFTDNEFLFEANPKVTAFISNHRRKVDFNNLTSGTTLYLSVAAQNTAGISVPSAPIAVRTL